VADEVAMAATSVRPRRARRGEGIDDIPLVMLRPATIIREAPARDGRTPHDYRYA
jgi:hypothetical protein